jgi:hypothetical protein
MRLACAKSSASSASDTIAFCAVVLIVRAGPPPRQCSGAVRTNESSPATDATGCGAPLDLGGRSVPAHSVCSPHCWHLESLCKPRRTLTDRRRDRGRLLRPGIGMRPPLPRVGGGGQGLTRKEVAPLDNVISCSPPCGQTNTFGSFFGNQSWRRTNPNGSSHVVEMARLIGCRLWNICSSELTVNQRESIPLATIRHTRPTVIYFRLFLGWSGLIIRLLLDSKWLQVHHAQTIN